MHTLAHCKHKAVDVLRRLNARQQGINQQSFEKTFTERLPHLLFHFSDDHQPHSLVGTFRKFKWDIGLLRDSAGQTPARYSQRHAYITTELSAGTDIHTLARQMGISVQMLKSHYSKLKAT